MSVEEDWEMADIGPEGTGGGRPDVSRVCPRGPETSKGTGVEYLPR